MSYRVRPSESLQASVRRIARDRLDDAVAALERAQRGTDLHEGVHEARKRCKQVRGLTRLVREAAPDVHDEVNPRVRDAGRSLSTLRDATALLETLDDLADEVADDLAAHARAIRAVLAADREAAGEQAGDAIAEACAALRAVREDVGAWDVPEDVEAMAAGVARTYARGRDALADVVAEPSTTALHQWRKRVKYHRYHVRLLAPTWPPLATAAEGELHRLTDLLGDDHDLAVLRGVLAGHDGLDGDDVRAVAAMADRRRAELQQAAVPLGRRVHAVHPDGIADLVAACWAAWRAEAGADLLPLPLALATAG